MSRMLIEIFSDVVCPWCYLGKRRFEAALAGFEHRDEVQVRWRSFELDPGAAPSADGEDYAGRLARKYGKSRADAQQMLDSMTATAAGEGLDYHFERAVHANTFAAHQMIHLAAEHGLQEQAKERLLRGYFTEGADLNDHATLATLAGEAGVDAGEAGAALRDQRFADAVRQDEAEAARLGVSAVPFFVLDRRYGIPGAQPAEVLLGALNRAWDEREPQPAGPDGSACGADGCAV